MLTAFSTSFLVGISFNVLIVDIPQRLQIVNGLGSLEAGIRLIPYTLATPLGSVVANMAASKHLLLPIHLMLLGSILQVVGIGLITTIPVQGVTAAQYGFQILAGFGVGMTFGILLLITPFTVEKRDLGKHL
jgi:hypothetical protein